jgi:uncharacterized membrane protein (GlpM family)
MSPDLMFWIGILAKMAVAAGFVVTATVVAERAGAFIGSLIVTLPVSTGPAYVFIALDHDDEFVALAALASVVNNVPTLLYTLSFVLLAQKLSAGVSVTIGLIVWLILTVLLNMMHWELLPAIALNLACALVAYRIAFRFRNVPMIRLPLRWPELLVRASIVSLVIAAVVTLSFSIGPERTGILASFPATFTSTMLILHRRVGGSATAAVMAHSLLGLLGFGFCMAVLYLTAEPLGAPLALTVALAFSLSWNATLLLLRGSRPALEL